MGKLTQAFQIIEVWMQALEIHDDDISHNEDEWEAGFEKEAFELELWKKSNDGRSCSGLGYPCRDASYDHEGPAKMGSQE